MRASGGYCGTTFFISLAACTSPPTGTSFSGSFVRGGAVSNAGARTTIEGGAALDTKPGGAPISAIAGAAESINTASDGTADGCVTSRKMRLGKMLDREGCAEARLDSTGCSRG